MKTRAIPILLICFAAAIAGAADLIVIELHDRSAAELLPTLKPMVGTDVSLSGVDYKLLVRGSAAEITKIRELVAVLDRPAKQLLVSVRYSETSRNQGNRIGATVSNQGPHVEAGTTLRTDSDHNVSSVRLQEGGSAHISSGQSVPIVTAFIPSRTSIQGTGIALATDYRELTSGFNVKPRVNGNQVVLEISAQEQRANESSAGNAQTYRASTTIAGSIGEWIEISNVASSGGSERAGANASGGGRIVRTQVDGRSLSVKVELAQ